MLYYLFQLKPINKNLLIINIDELMMSAETKRREYLVS
ncbi:hypothetical protein ENHYD8BJ_140064 [Enhydrobacter sp. 8BJ]|nr:hypothetical protein ENHYD8BJ_140064 [Enhydrobacter sp. 8BJ]